MSMFALGFAMSALWLPPLIAYSLVKRAFAVGISFDPEVG